MVGGAGGIGQPLSMLMAMDPNVAELCVYDLTIAMIMLLSVLTRLNKRKTRKARSVRSSLTGPCNSMKKRTHPTHTTKKSKIFHDDLWTGGSGENV